MSRRTAVCVLVAAAATFAHAQAVYPSLPDWQSQDQPVSTGAALVDLDLDGWLDLVVSNGNDMSRQRVAVYYNRRDGTLPPLPDWQSGDTGFNGPLDVADVNGDGWPDVAVAILGSFSATGPIARLYLNNAGTLSTFPDWEADIIGHAFGVAFGDMNNDGRPDLAVATGWAYSPQHYYANRVYLNVDGTLEASASWVSSDTDHLQGVHWVDADGDGWLDLAGAAARTAPRVYRNNGGMLETTPAWLATDVTYQAGIMVVAGDVTGDGLPDLFVADNSQIGGSGMFRQYDGLPGGMFDTVASWTQLHGYCSAVAVADVNADGRLDLAGGSWWGQTFVYMNTGAGLSHDWPENWFSAQTSVVEKLVFGDIDKNGLRAVEHVCTPGRDGDQRLFQLPHRPVQDVIVVERDGEALAPHAYCLSREHGWITVNGPVLNHLRIAYTVSTKLDLAVTNWGTDESNVAYYSRIMRPGDANCDGCVDFDDIDPFVSLLEGSYETQFPYCDGPVSCDFDQNGRVDFDDIDAFVEALAE